MTDSEFVDGLRSIQGKLEEGGAHDQLLDLKVFYFNRFVKCFFFFSFFYRNVIVSFYVLQKDNILVFI